MSDGHLTILDGTHLRALQLHLPSTTDAINGAQLRSLAESSASSSMFDISLPQTLTSNALKRLNLDDSNTFDSTILDRTKASSKLWDYVTAIANELRGNRYFLCQFSFPVFEFELNLDVELDDPLVISVLDGTPLRVYLEDEDDFAMLVESLFTELDRKDKGKIKRNEIRNAIVLMGVQMGVPPFSGEIKLGFGERLMEISEGLNERFKSRTHKSYLDRMEHKENRSNKPYHWSVYNISTLCQGLLISGVEVVVSRGDGCGAACGYGHIVL
ncbi:hypothetical protein GIB67_008561 [Kingdonia uniflora]|uniref:EF-hand domain-containing protein n=1 Tax=Kingdonia uniflora TaxID=39325 RepID=A0A7J7N444_9MAGN|nr:hypothetical protein GIB67_008561 [Kingdonia uniflora]